MRTLRGASIVIAFVAATALVLGTAGFTAMNADRGLDVSTTDDESAFLGYNTLTGAVNDETPESVVEYHNQFEHDLDEFHVDVSIVDPDDTDARLVDTETPTELPADTNKTVDVTLTCPVEEEVHLQFEATGSGGGVSVSFDRVQTVTCVPDDSDGPDSPVVTGVHYNDAANADIDTEGSDGSVTATVWIVDSPPVNTSDAIEPVVFNTTEPLDTAKKIRPQIVQSRAPNDLPDDWKIVAIEFPSSAVAYVHPQWNAGEYDTPKTGDGVVFADLPLDADTLVHASIENGEVVVDDAASGSSGTLIKEFFWTVGPRTTA